MATVNGTEVVKGKQLRQGSNINNNKSNNNNWIAGSCIIDVRLQVSSSVFFFLTAISHLGCVYPSTSLTQSAGK